MEKVNAKKIDLALIAEKKEGIMRYSDTSSPQKRQKLIGRKPLIILSSSVACGVMSHADTEGICVRINNTITIINCRSLRYLIMRPFFSVMEVNLFS